MTYQEIKKVVLELKEGKTGATPMLLGEIPGATVVNHLLSAEEEVTFDPSSDFMRILFLCRGEGTFRIPAWEKSWSYGEKAVFTAKPQDAVVVKAQADLQLIEIQWELRPADWAELLACTTEFPYTEKYAEALQYRDPFKSEKTISRAIIPQRIVPRFAMGSVETYGDDLIGQHEHPLLDQFFFSFPENNMDLLLDDMVYPMEGNTLLHIPLGCNHGVSVKGQQCAHYIWIDFLFDEKGAAYLDEVHKATGTKREF